MPPDRIARKDTQPGLLIDHLGTIYEVLSVQGEQATVLNPKSKFRATVNKSMLARRSRRVNLQPLR